MFGKAAVVAAAAVALAGCAPRPKMCASGAECAAKSACVAGRCQPDRPNVKPAIDSARRWLVPPVDVAYLRGGDPAGGGALPPVFVLGRERAVLLLRFDVAIPQASNVVEAYVLLRRAGTVDEDPSPISLHATRIIDAWEGRSTSWALQPRTREVRAPSTTVAPGGPSIVRVDVRELVRRWPKRDPADQGIAIVAEGASATGTTFALTDLGVEQPAEVEPCLELYLR